MECDHIEDVPFVLEPNGIPFIVSKAKKKLSVRSYISFNSKSYRHLFSLRVNIYIYTYNVIYLYKYMIYICIVMKNGSINHKFKIKIYKKPFN